MISEHDFASSEALARRVADQIEASIAARREALIAVSGGKSPVPLFEALARTPLDWGRVTVTLVDERWVAPDHADSNERLVCAHLLQNEAAAARFVPLKNDAATAAEGQKQAEAAIAALPLPFDAIVLGMGEDAHTASLFPEAAELAHALSTPERTAAVTPPAAPHERMTLTLAGLMQSRLLLLPLSGARKIEVYREALGPGPVETMPVRAVLHQDRVPVEVWIGG